MLFDGPPKPHFSAVFGPPPPGGGPLPKYTPLDWSLHFEWSGENEDALDNPLDGEDCDQAEKYVMKVFSRRQTKC